MKRKSTERKIWSDDDWVVIPGRVVKGRGRQPTALFQFVAEKLPYDCLSSVSKYVRKAHKRTAYGVYLAQDSFGVARYGGRGEIFTRLAQHKRDWPKELEYFSFFIIKSETHEREIETAILRAAGPEMVLNERKVRTGLETGSILDYEAGTHFLERQSRRGRRKRRRRSPQSK